MKMHRQRIESRLHEAALLTEAHCDWSRFGFGSIISPFEFKTHVEKVFRSKLTATEAAALVDKRINSGVQYPRFAIF